MSTEFPNKLSCIDICPYSHECGTRLLLGAEPCKQTASKIARNLSRNSEIKTYDAKSNGRFGIRIASTPIVASLWLVRAMNPEWTTEVVYEKGRLQTQLEK